MKLQVKFLVRVLSEGLSEDPSEGSSEAPSKDTSEGPSLNPNDGVDFVREMISNMSNVIALQNVPREKYDALTMEQCEEIKKA